ncbi:MAG: hypothetical protein HFH84_03765 [Lachnospiraceae bacterium]|jgi:hypothetical protein|nr:hypothetical protein [Lachnospiraceae bacterium]
MKHNGYEESEKGMSFSGESRQGQALRIMEALSGADEELLERSENERAQSISTYKKRKYVKGRGFQPLWRYARPWAAVLCLAVVGALGWGGYQLILKVDNPASGGNMNDMAMQLETIELDAEGEGALPEEAGAAEYNAEDMAAQKADDSMSQDNGGDFDEGIDANGTNVTEGYSGSQERYGTSGTSQHGSGGTEEKSSETATGMGKEQESVSKESAAEESVMIDSDGCPAVNLNKFTEAEARSQEGLGDYIPEKVPQGYSFESAFSNADGQEANLTLTWSKGMDSIMWSVEEVAEAPETVDIDAAETYDERLYEIPYAETVPQEYRQSMDNPTFAWEDFTLETVRSRMISRADRGDTDTPRGNFAVLLPNNIVVRFNGRGTAEEIWEMFDSIKITD